MTNIRPLNILLAEDNQDHADLIIDTLKQFQIGNKVIHVNNGEAVLEMLAAENTTKEDKPDLILLDLKMPRMDGASTLQQLRMMGEYKTVPVVMISTSGMDEDIKKCYLLGANSYITKPLKFEELTRKIRELNLYWVLTSEIPKNT